MTSHKVSTALFDRLGLLQCNMTYMQRDGRKVKEKMVRCNMTFFLTQMIRKTTGCRNGINHS